MPVSSSRSSCLVHRSRFQGSHGAGSDIDVLQFRAALETKPAHAVWGQQPDHGPVHLPIIDYALGNDGYPLTHEWTLYIFDALLMFIVMIIYYVWYPTWIQPAPLQCEMDEA